jgi:hypothetical protein
MAHLKLVPPKQPRSGAAVFKKIEKILKKGRGEEEELPNPALIVTVPEISV